MPPRRPAHRSRRRSLPHPTVDVDGERERAAAGRRAVARQRRPVDDRPGLRAHVGLRCRSTEPPGQRSGNGPRVGAHRRAPATTAGLEPSGASRATPAPSARSHGSTPSRRRRHPPAERKRRQGQGRRAAPVHHRARASGVPDLLEEEVGDLVVTAPEHVAIWIPRRVRSITRVLTPITWKGSETCVVCGSSALNAARNGSCRSQVATCTPARLAGSRSASQPARSEALRPSSRSRTLRASTSTTAETRRVDTPGWAASHNVSSTPIASTPSTRSVHRPATSRRARPRPSPCARPPPSSPATSNTGRARRPTCTVAHNPARRVSAHRGAAMAS